jgi:hypothetical protein
MGNHFYTPVTDKKSCADHMTAGVTKDGEYLIDSDGDGWRRPYRVYCQFDTTTSTAWTLVSSWRKDKNYMFQSRSFSQNTAVEQNTPREKNSAYRLSKARMEEIRSSSDIWRSSCNMEKTPQQDFVIAKFSEMDFVSFNGGGVCKKMIKYDIRGKTCSDCNAPWWQSNSGYALHIDSGGDHCGTSGGVKQIGTGAVGSEDNFGYYGSPSSQFACTASNSATTQFWMGDYAKSSPTSSKRSCKDWKDAGTTTNGEYLIDVDGTGPMRPFKAYCNFNYDGKAWTLVTSWRKDRNYMFQNSGFGQSRAVNQDMPQKKNEVYRLSLQRMNELRSQSTHWYSACNMETNPSRDSVRAKFSSMDFVSYIGGGGCYKMEYVNVRGNTCTNCNAPWWQSNSGYALHIDSGGNHCGSSGLGNIHSGAVGSEDNFGYYGSPASGFKCTQSSSSTTQFWMGQ